MNPLCPNCNSELTFNLHCRRLDCHQCDFWRPMTEEEMDYVTIKPQGRMRISEGEELHQYRQCIKSLCAMAGCTDRELARWITKHRIIRERLENAISSNVDALCFHSDPAVKEVAERIKGHITEVLK